MITESWSNVKFKSYEQYKSETDKQFELTSDEYYALRNGKCAYCDRPTTDVHCNGIDRIDNNVGYVKENCVTCCHDCNMMKLISTSQDFIGRTIKVATHAESVISRHIKSRPA
jgi:5-methylcytosine-specific restriction endonuclease McrA